MAITSASRLPKDIKFTARPDTLDYRDRIFEPTLVEIPVRTDIAAYRALNLPILYQGEEWACTGFALATVVHYLLRTRTTDPDTTEVSPRMLYEMAKRFDEYPGESYEGSSARGAMKGWHKCGVCRADLWEFRAHQKDRRMTPIRAEDAARRPLGAYYRVNHTNLTAMHAALAEVGILFAVIGVHKAWLDGRRGPAGRYRFEKRDALIPPGTETLGNHAIAIVGYDERGFWIQNSWGPTWRDGGLALVSYEDWLAHGRDAWVARLGAPVTIGGKPTLGDSADAWERNAQALRPHIVRIGDGGQLRSDRSYGTSEDDLKLIFEDDYPRITRTWDEVRFLLFADGGCEDEPSTVQRAGARYREQLRRNHIYPLSFVWKTDFWRTLAGVLRDSLARIQTDTRESPGFEFMQDRHDDALEPLVRRYGGRVMWEELKKGALASTMARDGGARRTLNELAKLAARERARGRPFEINLVAHSAGAIFAAPLVQLLTGRRGRPLTTGPMKGRSGLGLTLHSVTLWAPACTVRLFKDCYLPAIERDRIERFAIFTLTDAAEQDDNCASIYDKSLLYLVSHALEESERIPDSDEKPGEPIVGMANALNEDDELRALFKRRRIDWVRSPNSEHEKSLRHSTARRHGDFPEDLPTLRTTLARILEKDRRRRRRR